MAQDKHQSDQNYMEQELAQAQQGVNYGEEKQPAEQYASPESMRVKKATTHKGRKSQTKGYQG